MPLSALAPGVQVPFVPEARPLKPRPVLLVVMAAVFAAWMACLVLMYVKTVWPVHR